MILGAGPAGLAVARELSENGVQVTVLERNRYVGGLAATFEHEGYKFDLGGHRWFTKNEDLNHWFRRLMDGELVLVNRISRIYHERKYFSYPIELKEILTKCDPLTIARIAASFLWSSLRQAAFKPRIKTMEQAYIAQFGATLYEMFFRQYSEKVWGLPCTEISADWVAQRSRGLSIWDLARDALLGPKKGIVSLVDEFMYPRDGYGRISERMAEDVRSRGNKVLLDCPVTRIVHRGPGRFEVFYRLDGTEVGVTADNVVSTIPLGRLIFMLEPACDSAALEAAKLLTFRDLITVNLMLRKRQVSKDTWLYIQDSDIIFGRLHEPKNWSAAMVPGPDRTSLVLECFCSQGDALWSMSDQEIGDRCIRDLVEKLNFIERDEVEGVYVIRTRFAYPVYDLAYQSKLSLIQEQFGRYAGLHIVGRSGTFRYNNADHSIEMGILLGRELLGEDADHMSVNTEQEYHEEKRIDAPKAPRIAAARS